jgi:hypothetical protein
MGIGSTSHGSGAFARSPRCDAAHAGVEQCLTCMDTNLDRFLIERVHAHGRATQHDTSIQHSPRKVNFILASKSILQPHAPPRHAPRRWTGHLAASLTAAHAASCGFTCTDAPLSTTPSYIQFRLGQQADLTAARPTSPRASQVDGPPRHLPHSRTHCVMRFHTHRHTTQRDPFENSISSWPASRSHSRMPHLVVCLAGERATSPPPSQPDMPHSCTPRSCTGQCKGPVPLNLAQGNRFYHYPAQDTG